MRQRLVIFLIVIFLLVACSSNSADDSNDASEEVVAGEPAADEAEAEPTAEPPTVAPTLAPTATPTDVPTVEPTMEPTAIVEPEPTVTEETPEEEETDEGAVAVDEEESTMASVPDLVWLPYSSGSYGNPVLTLQDGEIVYEDEPDAIEAFFDYADGRMAFGMEFWYAADNGLDAVTDLWIYDYAIGESELWLDGNVGRAAWSPAQDTLAVALHNGTVFDLVLMSGPDDWVILNKDIDPFYSWSPDGEQIAFVRDGELFITSLDGQESYSLTNDMYQESSWVGDAPLWLSTYGLLAYADFPVTFVSLDGVEVYEPISAEGDVMDVDKRPFQMLWSSSQQQLIMQYEGMFGPSLQIFQFAEDIYTITEVFDLGEGYELVDWYEEGESIIILQNGEPQIYSLSSHEIASP